MDPFRILTNQPLSRIQLTTMLSYLVEIEGYRARIERDREGVLWGRVIEMEEIIFFKSVSTRMVERNFALALEAYFERCRSLGVEPEKPPPTGL